MKRFTLIVLLFIFGLSSMASKTHAQTSQTGQLLRISPVILQIPLSPAKNLTYEMTVENLSASPLPLRATLTDFASENEDGGYVFSDTKKNPLLKWISLSENEFILDANEKKTLRLEVATPKTIKPGGYYGIVFFEPVLPPSGQQTTIATRIGLLVLGTLGFADQNKAEILTFSLPRFSNSFSLPYQLRVKNAGLNYFTAKPIVTVKPLLGEEKQIFVEEKIIFPDTVRRWEENLSLSGMKYGFYNVALSISTADNNRVTRNQWIIIFPFLNASLLIGSIALITGIIVFRKRIRRAIKAFIHSGK